MEINFLKTMIRETFKSETFRGLIKYRARLLLIILLSIIILFKLFPDI
jgi:hypothetical protein